MKKIDPEYRIKLGTYVIIYTMIMRAISGIELLHFSFSDSVSATFLGIGSTLISLGIIKQHKAFRNGE